MEQREILERFAFPSRVTACVPHGNGHINHTFRVETEAGRRYVLQALNPHVFAHPEQVMSNIYKVTEFLRARTDEPRGVMQLVPLTDGSLYYTDETGTVWRAFDFIDDAICLEQPESAADFYQCAVAFGRFQKLLTAFPAKELYETIPQFHDTEKRYADLLCAIEEDRVGRAASVQEEIAFIKARAPFYGTLTACHREGKLPLRVTHNDTKCNNVMLDKATRTALCVIDLDTIMPGFSVTDFGDAVRYGASTAAEDERDLAKVRLDMALYRAFAEGFAAGCGGLLEADELRLLPEGAKMMTAECGMRFLTDYLNGDVYFKTAYPTHNLDRCRTQLKLVAEMESHWDEMKRIAEELASK